MIEAFQNINKAFESKVRLGIMAVLMVNEFMQRIIEIAERYQYTFLAVL